MDADEKLRHLGDMATGNQPRAEIEAWMSGNGVLFKTLRGAIACGC